MAFSDLTFGEMTFGEMRFSEMTFSNLTFGEVAFGVLSFGEPTGHPRICTWPILCLLFVKNLPEWIKSNMKMFTDDSMVWRRIKAMADGDALQEDLQEVHHSFTPDYLNNLLSHCVINSSVTFRSSSREIMHAALELFVLQHLLYGTNFQLMFNFRTVSLVLNRVFKTFLYRTAYSC